jgi:hypothetical protein
VSDIILKLIPSSPGYLPEKESIDQAVSMVKISIPSVEDIKVMVSEGLRFIDPGTNWERILCPNCNASIDMEWWQNAMDKAFKNGFRDLSINVPCCSSATSLNELRYEWPAGFAKFSIEIRNPKIDIPNEVLKRIEAILGISLRKIWAHY